MAIPLLTLLVNPNAFFSRDASEWEPLRVPALIVLVAAILAGATAYLTTGLVAGIMPSEVQAYQGVMGIVGTVGAIAAIFVFWVAWAAVLLLESGSNSLAVTTAVLVNVPPRRAVATIVTVALAPLFRLPRSHVMIPLWLVQPPWLAVADTALITLGSPSVTRTRTGC